MRSSRSSAVATASRSPTLACTKAGAGRHALRVAGDERVQDDHLVAGAEQPLRGDAADVAGAAGDQDSHLHLPRVRGVPPDINMFPQ